jgi:lysophospholipase L1-like esterase
MRDLIFIFIFCLPGCLAGQTIQIKGDVRFLALGDSYTIGQNVALSERWPMQLIDSIRAKGVAAFDARIIATTGWRSDNLKAAIAKENLPNNFTLVSLLIGVNNYYQGKSVESYVPEFSELLETAVSLAGGDRSSVFVVSIPDYGYTPFGQSDKDQISAGINAYNAANKTVADDKGILYINITDISRRGLNEPDLVANDGLHPSGKQYTEWVRRILQYIDIEGGEVITDVDEHNVSGIRLSPNPFHDVVGLHDPPLDAYNLTLTVYNANGKLMLINYPSGKNDIQFDLQALPAGMYYAEVSCCNHTTLLRTKLIKR